MSYINNGNYRQRELAVKTEVNGQATTQNFNLLAAFTATATGKDYPELTSADLQHMPEAAYQERLDYFIRHVVEQVNNTAFVYEDAVTNKAYGSTADADAPDGLVCAIQ